MSIQAIVYTSYAGHTKEYAHLLTEKTHLPVYELTDALKTLPEGACVIYLGWLMAGSIKGLKKAQERFSVDVACGVGMARNGSQLEDVRKANNLPEQAQLFTLQGGYDRNKLHGMYKFMMTVMEKTLGKKLMNKTDRTPEEDEMLDLLLNGGNKVSEENLVEVMQCLSGHKEC